MSNRIKLTHFTIYLAFVCVLAALSFLSLKLSPPMSELLLKEGGVVENLSAIGYLLCIFFLFYVGRATSLSSHWYLYVILLAMALRELDFDKRFTATGVLKSKFIVADDVGLVAKVIGSTIVLFVLWSVFIWIRNHGKQFIQGVVQLQSSSWAAGFAMFFVVFTKSIDGLARKLEPLGIQVSTELNVLSSRTEEIFELGIPITLFCAIFLYWGYSGGSEKRPHIS